ncbi:Rpn family recombination-promoting nuclease/putative transposase [Limosilactobacillus caccae]|uniref:Rpn family recombination-promoting nuclease/putative transposase n=1 Tax=Limosilactobacillus caccae TaxID=1926284 RepID=UPI00097051E0|nr:Rpn family recombination-promoting nuclease/putative transposase [Limosilactobacillus caccae]
MPNSKLLAQARRSWEEAGLANDFVFNKVMLDKRITLEVLRRVLPALHLKRVKQVVSQQEFTSSHDAKGVRLDIYVEDDQHNRFDIEMQVVDKHNLPQRIRFYHANLAMDCYEKGQNYATADNSYVIFFCCFDPFGFGEQEYQIERSIKGHPEATYADGEQTLVFDVTSLCREVNPKLQQFLDVIANRQVGDDDDFIVQLEKRITFVKQNRKWRREYMQRSLYEMDIENSIALAKEQGLSQGLEKGLSQGKAAGIKEGRAAGIKEGLSQGKAAAEYEERVAMVRGLLNMGQQHDQIINFLVKTRNLTTKQAEGYYQAAIK